MRLLRAFVDDAHVCQWSARPTSLAAKLAGRFDSGGSAADRPADRPGSPSVPRRAAEGTAEPASPSGNPGEYLLGNPDAGSGPAEGLGRAGVSAEWQHEGANARAAARAQARQGAGPGSDPSFNPTAAHDPACLAGDVRPALAGMEEDPADPPQMTEAHLRAVLGLPRPGRDPDGNTPETTHADQDEGLWGLPAGGAADRVRDPGHGRASAQPPAAAEPTAGAGGAEQARQAGAQPQEEAFGLGAGPAGCPSPDPDPNPVHGASGGSAPRGAERGGAPPDSEDSEAGSVSEGSSDASAAGWQPDAEDGDAERASDDDADAGVPAHEDADYGLAAGAGGLMRGFFVEPEGGPRLEQAPAQLAGSRGGGRELPARWVRCAGAVRLEQLAVAQVPSVFIPRGLMVLLTITFKKRGPLHAGCAGACAPQAP